MWRWNREFQRREGRRYTGVLPGDEAERRGSRSAEQRTRVAKITANPSRGAAHAGRSTYPRAAYSGRTFAEGQAADCAQLERPVAAAFQRRGGGDRKSTRLNSSHSQISYAVFCLKKKKNKTHLYSRQQKKKKTNN